MKHRYGGPCFPIAHCGRLEAKKNASPVLHDSLADHHPLAFVNHVNKQKHPVAPGPIGWQKAEGLLPASQGFMGLEVRFLYCLEKQA
eukprot:1153494-Pelagomonas_calceolata.AAC.5